MIGAARQGALTTAADPVLYVPAAQGADATTYSRVSGGIAVRAAGDPAALLPFIRATARALDADAPVFNVMRLEDRLKATFAQPRFYALALGVFAALALSTAVLGVYGVLSYNVEMRRREFGVRRALGADQRHILGLVVRQSVWLSAIGLAAGLIVAAIGAGSLRALLFGIQPLDARSFAIAASIIVLVAAGAAWPPARRALRIDPARALRVD